VNEKPLGSKQFVIYKADKTVLLKGITDASGNYTAKLVKGSTLTVEFTESGEKWSFELNIPNKEGLNSFTTVCKISLEAGKIVVPETSHTTHLIFKVTDENNVYEQEAVISLSQNGNEVYNCTTGLDGTCSTDIDQYQTYDLTISKFGRTFKKKIELPKNERYSEYVYNITIQVVTQYKRTYTLENVYFDYDKSDIRAESFPALNTLYSALKENPAMVVEIAGHTDNKGPDDYNMELSQRRSNAVRDYLVKKGISSKRILPKGYGENEPIDTNDTDAGRQKNRRTEVRVISE
jgi:outer membrane protein OmpA-like peptidoglycan-associated protein